MKKIFCILMTCLVITVFAACGEKAESKPAPNPNDPFYGTWYYDDNIGMRTFYEFDGLERVVITYMDISDICKYEFDNNTLTTITKRDETTITHTYTYKFEGAFLTLTEGDNVIKLIKDTTAG